MGTDRSLILSMRAHAAGLVDFSQSRFEDPTWWRRLRFILDELSDSIDRDYTQIAHRHYLALVGCTTDSDLKQQFFKEASDQFRSTIRKVYAWYDTAAADRAESAKVAEEYNKHVGDMNDPAYKQQVNLLVEELNQRRLKTIQTTREREETARKMSLSKIEERKKNRKR